MTEHCPLAPGEAVLAELAAVARPAFTPRPLYQGSVSGPRAHVHTPVHAEECLSLLAPAVPDPGSELLGLYLITPEPSPARVTVTAPCLVTLTIDTARILHTGVTARAPPPNLAPTLTRGLALPVLRVTPGPTVCLVTQTAPPARLTLTLSGLGARATKTSCQGNTRVTRGPCPARATSALPGSVTVALELLASLAANRLCAKQTFPP